MASGLSFLHKEDDTNGMIHSDIKSGSILLDAEWNAKISNLELASPDWKVANWKHDGDDYGSLGFMDPERKGYVTRKSDWYSFSRILLEMFCGRYAKDLKPWSFYNTTPDTTFGGDKTPPFGGDSSPPITFGGDTSPPKVRR